MSVWRKRNLLEQPQSEPNLVGYFLDKVRFIMDRVVLLLVFTLVVPVLIWVAVSTAQTAENLYTRWFPQTARVGSLAPLFTQEVSYWDSDIRKWAAEHELEPNMLATVMQIESCGHPTVNSYAGAQGLFQVMPFHFASTEDMHDPDTNALRGALFLKQCLGWSSGDVGLAFACYNGGPSVIQMNSAYWDQQVKDYYKWGTGIYADALTFKRESDTLNRWLAAGGSRLCNMASSEIGLQ